MNGDELDRELSRMIAAVKADAEPALLTRARARIEARVGWPALVRWAMRPAALGASLALFLVSAGLSLALMATAPGSEAGESGTLMESLLAERGIDDVSQALSAPASDSGSAPDSGQAP
jgi:hypothetical protein